MSRKGRTQTRGAPCPWCGGKPETSCEVMQFICTDEMRLVVENRYQASCSKCGAKQGKRYVRKSDALRAWDRRIK